MAMSRVSPRRRSRIHCGGSSGCRSLLTENSASALHARQNSCAVCFARSLPLCQTRSGLAPSAAALAATRATPAGADRATADGAHPPQVRPRRRDEPDTDAWTVQSSDSFRNRVARLAGLELRYVPAAQPSCGLVSSMLDPIQPGHREEAGVGGWLLLLCRLLVVFHPLSLAVTASNALGALPARGTAVALILILRLIVVGFGMAAGRALQTVAARRGTLGKDGAAGIGGDRRLRLHHAVLPEQQNAGRHDLLRHRLAGVSRGMAGVSRSLVACPADLRAVTSVLDAPRAIPIDA